MSHPLPCALLLLAGAALAESAPPPADDFLRLYTETRFFQSGYPRSLSVTPEGDAVFFLRSPSQSPVQSLFALDPRTGEVRAVLPPAAVSQGAEQPLSAAEQAVFERKRLSARGVTAFQLSQDGARMLVGLPGRLF